MSPISAIIKDVVNSPMPNIELILSKYFLSYTIELQNLNIPHHACYIRLAK